MLNWSLKTLKIKDLKEHPKNPRILGAQQGFQLQSSMEHFGIAEKPIVNLDNTIIGGHQRLKILKKMKIKELDCLMPDRMLTKEEVNELSIRLNRNHGEWDWDKLANEWELDELVAWGFNLDELHLDMDTKKEKPQDESCKCPTCGKKMKKSLDASYPS